MIEKIFEAGVVGCGGAGFPTHVKLDTSADLLIINGAECEPVLKTDRYLMLNRPTDLLCAIEAAAAHLGVKRAVIALKKTYLEEIAALEAAIKSSGSITELFLLDNFYPAGDEHIVCYEVSGAVVPPGGIPRDIGIVVSNVGTMICVSDALKGRGFTHKYVTVAGHVPQPIVAHVPIGTSVAECIDSAGGAMDADYSVVVGGPLMGAVISREQAQTEPVTKTTSGIIVLEKGAYLQNISQTGIAHMLNRARAACVQCSFCTQLCPRHLLGHPLKPHRIMRKIAYSGLTPEILDDEDVKQALICCGCGVCTQFACPMQLQPDKINYIIKKEYAKADIRYDSKKEGCTALPQRDYRKVPSKRIAARVGVLPYYDQEMGKPVEYTPKKITVPLRQHIGAASRPVVTIGEDVFQGQLIAKCPEGQLGANIHAGIGGYVSAIKNGKIFIERRQ
ncbi:MAG: SLBB domain-containing protein [Clostridiales bacterium]|jgi:Na+-translocating ferredoxin:NAD+ oxidoreductase RnfC subunit|nr:SLBB domain-containing protein [Clostridiales bacterium]